MIGFNKKDKELIGHKDYNLAVQKYLYSLHYKSSSGLESYIDNISTSQVYDISNEVLNDFLPEMLQDRQKVAVVGSSGDQALLAIHNGCKDITLIDANLYTKPYVDYKIAMIKYFNHKEFITTLHSDILFHHMVYSKISHLLPNDSKEFWDTIMMLPNTENDYDTAKNLKEQLTHNDRTYRHFSTSFYKDIDEYLRLQKILNEGNFNLNFKTAEYKDFPESLGGNYNFIYLSNIYDYVDYDDYFAVVNKLIDNNLAPNGRLLLQYDFGGELLDDYPFPENINGIPVQGKILWIDRKIRHRDVVYYLDKPNLQLPDKSEKEL